MLRDPVADIALRQDGYVVVDLLEPSDVAGLNEAWRSLEAEWQPVWDPTGLAVTIRHPSLDERADSLLRPVVAEALEPHVEGTDAFLAAFLVKRPFSEELPPHLDWRLLDEVSEFTYGCWAPLEDVELINGGLGVFPGSHLSVDFDRTPAAPGHEWVSALAATDAERTVLEVQAGQAVIYDHRLVHFSPPNLTGMSRLATNTGLAPTHRVAEVRARLLEMMTHGMSGTGTAPQIPTSAS